MRDDTNEWDMGLNHTQRHGGQSEPSDMRADLPADLPAELVSTHQALTRMADAWSATTLSTERLAAFTRQIAIWSSAAAQHGAQTPLRERARREASETHGAHAATGPAIGRGRLLAGLVAAAVIVGLLSATLLKLAPGQPRQGAKHASTAVATAPLLTARSAEEPSQQPPSDAWTTVAREQLIPAPSDGDIVYRTSGAAASVSNDRGATWSTLTLPTLSQAHVASQSLSLAVSDTDPNIILLTVTLNLNSANPTDCPAGSTANQPTAMHGGILASGFITCNAAFVSQDGGATWTVAHGLTTVFATTTVWQMGANLYGMVNQIDRQVAPGFPLVGFQLMVSHDQGVTWSLMDSMLTPSSRYLCSVLPSLVDSALYVVTSAAPCYSGAEIAHILSRSVDDGASWRQVSTIDAFSAEMLASTPTLTGHGTWLYMLREQKPNGSSVNSTTESLLVSDDGGATWRDIPQPSQASASVSIRPVTGALSDGSLVVAAIEQVSGAVGGTPGPATFYAWRPGDSGWRPLTTSLTANYAVYFAGLNGLSSIRLTRGGQHAVDTLWVIEARSPYGPDSYLSHAYPIR